MAAADVRIGPRKAKGTNLGTIHVKFGTVVQCRCLFYQ